MSDTEHEVILVMHHIVTDGWSIGVAARELAVLYEAFRRGAASPLPEPPLQFADYAVWQRDRLQGERLAGLVAYWTDRLAGVPPLLLPPDRPRAAVRSARGGLRFFRVSAPPCGCSPSLRPQGRRDALHGVAGRLRGAPRAAFRPAGFRHRHAGRESRTCRTGRADWLFYQHASASCRSVGRSDVPRTRRSGAR